MSTIAENKNLIHKWVDSRNRGDLQAALDVWSEAMHETLKTGFSATTSSFPDVRIEIKEMIAEGDKVVLYSVLHGTHSGPFLDVAATGKTLVISFMDIYTIKDGKIQSIVRITDRLDTLNQMEVK
jgi:steroid delta-isomerase-like uncharacterized protein